MENHFHFYFGTTATEQQEAASNAFGLEQLLSTLPSLFASQNSIKEDKQANFADAITPPEDAPNTQCKFNIGDKVTFLDGNGLYRIIEIILPISGEEKYTISNLAIGGTERVNKHQIKLAALRT